MSFANFIQLVVVVWGSALRVWGHFLGSAAMECYDQDDTFVMIEG